MVHGQKVVHFVLLWVHLTLHDANADKGVCSARFPFIAPEDGLHEIKVSFSVFGNRAGNIRYEINHGEGSENVFVDQRQPHLKG